MLGENKLTSPTSPNGYHPSNVRHMQRNMDICMRPLKAELRIDTAGSGTGAHSGSTFVAWLNAVECKLIFDGTDTIGYILKPKGVNQPLPAFNDPNLEDKVVEICLFTDWGNASLKVVKQFAEAQRDFGCQHGDDGTSFTS